MTHAITLQQQWNILPAAARERLETIQDRYGPEAAQLATEAIREVFTESLTQVFRIAHTFRFCKQS
ncbi:MAG TPA: hypothetical protein VL461_11130 [Dictyobacter sp.]|nr:hypothetical protein [Dictyobacter sp.]